MWYLHIFLVLGILLCRGSYGQRHGDDDNGDCAAQWLSFSQCLRQQQRAALEKTGLSQPNANEQQNLDDDVRNCFRKYSCRDPIAPENENRARLDCFRRSHENLRNELQDCVRRDISGFSLPEDNFGSGDTWSMYLKQLNNAVRNYRTYCPQSTDQRDLRVCVEQALSDLGNKRQPQNGGDNFSNRRSLTSQRSRNYCEMRAQCSGSRNNGGMTESCDSEWRQRVVPKLCTCAQDLDSQGRVRRYESDFLACMNTHKIRVNTTSDPAFNWLENGLKTWCNRQQSSTDPCSRNRPDQGHRPHGQFPRTTTWNPGGFNFNWFGTTSSPPNWNGADGNGDENGNFGPFPTRTPPVFTDQPQGGGGFIGGPPPPQPPLAGGFGNLFGGGPFGGNNGFGSTNAGGNGDLFGGFLNNLGIGNPFEGGLLGNIGSFAEGFQNVLGGFGR